MCRCFFQIKAVSATVEAGISQLNITDRQYDSSFNILACYGTPVDELVIVRLLADIYDVEVRQLLSVSPANSARLGVTRQRCH